MKKLAFFAMALVVAGSASAEPVLESGPFTVQGWDGLDAFDCDGTVKDDFQQLPNGVSGLAAQDDQCYPFLAEIADNFTGDGDNLVGVGWWGVYWNGTPLPPDSFDITIYADDGGVPGAELATTNTADYNETAGDPNGYCSQIDSFAKADGVGYHLDVTAVFCFPPQYGHATGDGDGNEAHFKSDFFGFPDWVTATTVFGVAHDLAFILYNEEGAGTPVDETTWTGIKDLYK